MRHAVLTLRHLVMHYWVMTTAAEWYASLVGADSERTAATKAQIQQSTLNRQLASHALKPEVVVALARAYDASPLAGLVAIGLISTAEADRMSVDEALQKASDEQLAAAVLERVRDASEDGWLTRPMDAPAVRHLSAVSDRDEIIAARDSDDDDEAAAQTDEP